ncbi:THO complex subunit 6 homolog [Clavelina lepadiformis]|uniref:Uncharacterized protein n=1 Tax=Clavelina lepadiformis TaxID=159417 RepID=A0ABP0FSU7_CLALP
MELRDMLHVSMYCSALSPCGKYLAVGNNYGYICMFNLSSALSPNPAERSEKPVAVIKAHPGPVHALQTTQKYLISAGEGPITGWKWSDILNNKPKKSWTLDNQTKASSTSLAGKDTQISSYNCLCYKAKDDILYSGGDDNIAVQWDLNTGTCVESYNQHTEYIHDIDLLGDGIVTASEDGSVKIWDSRSNSCTGTFLPHANSQLNRPEVGKWVSCVTADPNGEWLAFGGGPHTSLWHVKSSSLVSVLDVENSEGNDSCFTPNTVRYFQDEIIAGGNQPILHRWHVNGQKKASTPCNINNIFSISCKSSDKGNLLLPMVITGSSWKMDVFTNLGYLGMTLSLVPCCKSEFC